ncbi:MAG: hypothetical protein LBU17_06300 [Treponema sp.]|jgi:hypothetical protein|nr:hypothetical protein [Treponema sp.]
MKRTSWGRSVGMAAPAFIAVLMTLLLAGCPTPEEVVHIYANFETVAAYTVTDAEFIPIPTTIAGEPSTIPTGNNFNIINSCYA